MRGWGCGWCEFDTGTAVAVTAAVIVVVARPQKAQHGRHGHNNHHQHQGTRPDPMPSIVICGGCHGTRGMIAAGLAARFTTAGKWGMGTVVAATATTDPILVVGNLSKFFFCSRRRGRIVASSRGVSSTRFGGIFSSEQE